MPHKSTKKAYPPMPGHPGKAMPMTMPKHKGK